MTIYVSELNIFDNGDDEVTFLGSFMASDNGLRELSDFIDDFGDIKRSDSAKHQSSTSLDAYFVPLESFPHYVVTPRCRRIALERGAWSLSLSLIVNKCSNGHMEDIWDDIFPFCV